MFSRRSTAEPIDTAPEPEVSLTKGRPTPKRRDAEAARKAALRTPTDPKAARKAERDRRRTDQLKARQAQLGGDERYLPARDRGPVRAFTRDFVDSRRSLGEVFVPAALLVLLLGMVPSIAVLAYYSWMIMLVVVVGEAIVVTRRLRNQAAQRWPDKAERKGITLYAIMRSLTIRKLRMPKPKVRPGGAPVLVKRKRA